MSEGSDIARQLGDVAHVTFDTFQRAVVWELLTFIQDHCVVAALVEVPSPVSCKIPEDRNNWC